MIYSNIPAAQSVIFHCQSAGIKDIVISPGSRNAPLTIGFANDGYFNCYSVVDERCAAFFALGMAQQLQRPVAVVCTSGSALLNYYPAVAEAFYSNIPLVVISADRPPHKIDIGDGQTIRQENVYNNHILFNANLELDVLHATSKLREEYPQRLEGIQDLESEQQRVGEQNHKLLQTALQMASFQKGPVHINVPFEEPLYGTTEEKLVGHIPSLSPSFSQESGDSLDEAAIDLWNSSTKKMILIGADFPNALSQEQLNQLGNDPSILVFTETTSNLHHPDFFPSIDNILAPIEKSEQQDVLFEQLRPQVLLTMGGMIVSKKIKAFLRKFRPEQHWHVGEREAYDSYFSLSKHFRERPEHFFQQLFYHGQSVASDYKAPWKTARETYRSKRENFVAQQPFSDFVAFHQLVDTFPKGAQLQLANSTTIRYMQLFDLDPSLKVFCNRGTSGIDGSVSTAVGASIKAGEPTILITGDLSFFYDSNGLWNQYIRPDFRIIVLNNAGGGIFRILPGHQENEVFHQYFETHHNLEVSHLCSLYGLEHHLAEDLESLKNELAHFYDPSQKAKILEIKTPRLLNNKILRTYFDFLS